MKNLLFRNKYIAMGLGLSMLILMVYYVRARGSAPDAEEIIKARPAAVQTTLVHIRPMDTIVTAQGTLTAAQGASVKIAPMATGKIVSVRVCEGDTVSAGEVVAVLDNRVAQAQAVSASAALRVSQIQARQAAAAEKAATVDYTNAVDTAKYDMELAQTELEKLERGARPQEIAQAKQSVKQAQATRDRAATEVDRVQFLYNKGIDSKRQLEDAKTALSVADAAFVTAREQASLMRAGARPEDLHEAHLKVKSTQAAFKRAKQGYLQLAAKRHETLAASESIRQKNADLTAAQATAAYSELRSPISGKVTRRSLNPGDIADTATPVMEIANTHSLNLVANIPAEDGAAIRTGMPAHISLATASGHIFTGSVEDVGQVDPQSGMLAVRITVPGSSDALKVGTFASADIVVHTNPSAIVVPKSAVITRNDHNVVFVVGKNNIAHQVNVITGVEQKDSVEIKSGVASGDQVISMGQYELTDGVKVRPVAHSIRP